MATTANEVQPRTRSRGKASAISTEIDRPALPRWAAFVLIFGLYLTFRGYHAFDGDQAYRLPLLLHRLDPTLYATDPFVRAFDQFNPHRGYLALLDAASRPFGLATALFALFAMTLVATSLGVDRLASAIRPDLGGEVGLLAVVLVLVAKAGNIGTNHLFDSTLLDRLIGFALGWLALASAVGYGRRSVWSGALCLGLAAFIHPSVGLQLALTMATAWGVWGFLSKWSGVSRSRAVAAIGLLGLAMIPGLCLVAGQGGRLFQGLPTEDFRLLSVLIQGPQHMLPSTWRTPQWLAWGCYPILAWLALGRVGLDRSTDLRSASRFRFAALITVNLLSLGFAYLAVEGVGDLRVTVFQPFRMATLARGLALVAISGRLIELWRLGDLPSRGRAVLIGVGLSGDWTLVVATAIELGVAAVDWAGLRGWLRTKIQLPRLIGLGILAFGLVFLVRHDTESGYVTLPAGIGALVVWSLVTRSRRLQWTKRRVALAIVGAWAVPVAAMIVPWVVDDAGSRKWSAALVERCRFAEIPTDDLERLAIWCRENTPDSSRFIGPPGPKTFRLWSRRSLAFNRAASPYHAKGLADWSSRYRAHVGFQGSTADFARAYLADRHALELGYGQKSDLELAELAREQGADYVLASAARPKPEPTNPLERVRVEGRYAIFRVRGLSRE